MRLWPTAAAISALLIASSCTGEPVQTISHFDTAAFDSLTAMVAAGEAVAYYRGSEGYPSAVLIDVVDDVAPPGNWTEASDLELVGRLITNIRGYVRAVDEVQEKSTGRTIAYLMSTQAQRVAYGGGGYSVGAAGASRGTGTARGLWPGGGAF